MTSKVLKFLFLMSCVGIYAQTFSGTVIDKSTNEPMEMVAVYFDNTTVGTTTDEYGAFSLDYSDVIQSTLVISFLGYETVYISNYRETNKVVIKLMASQSQLDEVVVGFDDGMTRKQKLRFFEENFLGTSKFGRSCAILNPEDIFLRYDKSDRTLTASSSREIIVENSALGYRVTYNLIDFEILFRYANLTKNRFDINTVTYYGTMFFLELHKDHKKKQRRFAKQRKKAYKGSVQHFMRSVYSKTFKTEGYLFSEGGFMISPYKYFTISEQDENGLVTGSLSKKVGIHYNKRISVMQPRVSEFKIDKYGNFYPITGLLFGGDMGDQRVGDTLPLDYNFKS